MRTYVFFDKVELETCVGLFLFWDIVCFAYNFAFKARVEAIRLNDTNDTKVKRSCVHLIVYTFFC